MVARGATQIAVHAFAAQPCQCVRAWLPSMPFFNIQLLFNCRSQQAVRLMRQQPAAGEPAYHIFNCGFSKWGAKVGGWGLG